MNMTVFEQPREIAADLFNSVVSKTQDLDTRFENDLLSSITADLPFDYLIDDFSSGSLAVSTRSGLQHGTQNLEKLNDFVQEAVRELEIRVHSYWDPARYTFGLEERAYEVVCDIESLISGSEINTGVMEVSGMAQEIRTHVMEIFTENDEIVSRMAVDVSRTLSELIHSPSRVAGTVVDTMALLHGLLGRVRDGELAFVEGSYDMINTVADETEAEVRDFIGIVFEEVSTICDMVPDCDEYRGCLQPPGEICHRLVDQLRLAELDMANSLTDLLRERQSSMLNVLRAFLIGRPHMSLDR